MMAEEEGKARCSAAATGGSGRRASSLHGRQLAAFLQLLYDIQAAHEVPVHIELRVGGPVRVLLQPLAHLLVPQDVEVPEPEALPPQQRHDARAEPALRRVRAALHEEHHPLAPHQRRQPLVQRPNAAGCGGSSRRGGGPGGSWGEVGRADGSGQAPFFGGQLLQNVQAAHQLPLDVQLWVGGPVGEGLQPLPHLLVPQNVKVPEGDIPLLKQGHNLAAEAAAGLLGVALHEEHDRCSSDQLAEPLLQAGAPPRHGAGLL
mmetsp:Transcript_21016/g.33195  ORF Transcript_21016/g.33195 Transcript_21016/m.33195 type:complete len:260 (+) Transcript_21016:316-1095(+)